MRKIIFFLFLASFIHLNGQSSGSLAGRVYEAETRKEIDNATVIIPNIDRAAYTDENGAYFIKDIKPGIYHITIKRIGYQSAIRTDIVVRPDKITFLNVELRRKAVDMEGVSVRDEVLFSDEDSGSNPITYSGEEVRRAPGSAGDISRIMMSLPSIAIVNDESNNLIVRGGNPFENTFYIDGIEVPNINHFPHQGSSGGPIGALNVDLINDVSFHPGGFPVKYGDKLSSVMDISFREGNRRRFESQLELSFIGFGGVIEGPIIKDRSTFVFSLRRSYLDFVIDWFDVGTSVTPKYGDMQSKITYEINPKNKLKLLGIWADDHNTPDRETALDNQMTHYGNQDLYQGTIGLNWRAVFSNKTFSHTVLSYTGMFFDEDWYETSTQNYSLRNRSFEQKWKLRNVTQTQITDNYYIEYGFDSELLRYSYDNYYGETTNLSGDIIPEFTLSDTLISYNRGVFLNHNLKVLPKLTFNFGIRTDYFDYNENTTFSPRLSMIYDWDKNTKIRSSAGLYHQNLKLLLLSQTESNKDLRDPKAMHYIIGVDRLLGQDTKLSIELYEKRYDHFPMDNSQPAIFVIDDDMFQFYDDLVDEGKALSRGIELVIQKKLMHRLYGLVSATYFKSQYKGLDDRWRDRGYDNRFAMSIEGGFKPDHYQDFSIRWIYAGGVPYTPYDLELSTKYNRLVYDTERVNEKRFPDYHSLNIRYDRRIFFDRSSLTFFLSIWNVYDRKNIAEYYWNSEEQKVDVIYQWRILPVFGIEYEF